MMEPFNDDLINQETQMNTAAQCMSQSTFREPYRSIALFP